MGGKLGTCLGKPVTDKINEQGDGNGLRYGIASMQGWRVHMEDAAAALAELGNAAGPAGAGWAYFGVFDGHAGAGVAAHCSQHLLAAVARAPGWPENPPEALRTGFLQLDADMRELGLRDAGGSTAVCALVAPDRLYIANCGDSRGVICRHATPVLVTRDHKPELPEESARIRRAGGTVLVSRLNGTLAVSRALGDYDYKNEKSLGQCEQLVSPEPEIFCWERDIASDEFLLLACDGVWDVMRNEEVCTYVHSLLQITDDLVEVTNRLIDTCLSKGSDDNMSVVLVTFPAAPKPSPEACKADKQLDERIRKCITEMVQNGERVKKLVYQELHQIPDFLPGGGIHDKWTLIQKIMEEVGLINDDEPMSDHY